MADTKIPADLPKFVRDATYVVVGLGVIGFQKAQVRRVELAKQLQEQGVDVRGQLTKLAKEVDERIDPVLGTLDGRLDELEDKLPEQVRDVVAQARKVAKDAREQLRSQLVGTAA